MTSNVPEIPEPELKFPVQGCCPRCGKSKLVLSKSGEIVCNNRDCDQPNAASLILKQASPEHVVKLTRNGYTAEHPLVERIDGTLFDCDFDKYVQTLTEPPMPPGLYAVEYQATSKMEGAWIWKAK